MLKNVMTKEEYFDWLRYFKYKTPDSLEIQLAVLSTLVSQGLGNKKAKVEDFIIHQEHESSVAQPHEMPMEDVSAFFGMMATPMN